MRQKLLFLVQPFPPISARKLTEVAYRGRLQGRKLPALVYVTPEISKRDRPLSVILSTLNDSQKLARFVIDEAHCLPGWGKDFRKYQDKQTMIMEIKQDQKSPQLKTSKQAAAKRPESLRQEHQANELESEDDLCADDPLEEDTSLVEDPAEIVIELSDQKAKTDTQAMQDAGLRVENDILNDKTIQMLSPVCPSDYQAFWSACKGFHHSRYARQIFICENEMGIVWQAILEHMTLVVQCIP
ncbi:uncharacterized protein BT62DRAFT_989955 [Guyanagaster necrorhizus]|uniref:Helicase ATP-binding domain-containing protein n=1 Tax=Guyanagaster necrorhizus TaxID=856835 RepID=A0A9P7W7W5_9AGAR|nr:uncharacterized protein BT62DRAFT_989955 [Guyanagaster necrorhizus MCA 3950]KAG7452951.1 hypothetical protein BT62DRAFT_989955 [Guyanagaster necrorhizus MCA 3950]